MGLPASGIGRSSMSGRSSCGGLPRPAAGSMATSISTLCLRNQSSVMSTWQAVQHGQVCQYSDHVARFSIDAGCRCRNIGQGPKTPRHSAHLQGRLGLQGAWKSAGASAVLLRSGTGPAAAPHTRLQVDRSNLSEPYRVRCWADTQSKNTLLRGCRAMTKRPPPCMFPDFQVGRAPLRHSGGPCSAAAGRLRPADRRGAFDGRSVSRSLRSMVHSRNTCATCNVQCAM